MNIRGKLRSAARHHDYPHAVDNEKPGCVVMFGTYDLGKPRNRQTLRALIQTGCDVVQIHANVWEGIEDKATMNSRSAFLRALKWICAYPDLIWRYLTAPKHDFVVVGYPGQFDVIVLRLFAWMRRAPIVWDVFISLYDTTVNDRKLVKRGSARSKLIWMLEWLACRCADRLFIDTSAHADYIASLYRIPRERIAEVFVGAETGQFPRLPPKVYNSANKVSALFYGQFIPLHGVEHIIDAARFDGGAAIDWRIVGRGQEKEKIAAIIRENNLHGIKWDEWVPYDELTTCIAEADVCLGIFGDGDKAGRVIPNKVFQIISSGRPLVTRDSPAIRELIPFGTSGIRLVPPADPRSIVAAIQDLARSGETPPEKLSETFGIDQISRQLKGVCESAERSETLAVVSAQ